MAKIIRNIIICLVLIVAAMTAFQWKNYQKKSECRENALLYFQEQDYQKAITYLQEGLDQMSFFGKEMDQDMSCYLGESYYQLGEYSSAIAIYDSLLTKNDQEKKYYILKAEACEGMLQHDLAVEVLQAGWMNTGDGIFLSKICDSYINAGDYVQALVFAQAGVDANNEESADFLFKEIVIYEKAENYQDAYQTAVKYVSLYPDDEKGQKELTFLSTRI